MYAVISDIHANLPALRAVLADIEAQGIDEVYCLGDVVGYGPHPTPCVDLIMDTCRATVMGNHEEALVQGAWGFHPVAKDAIEWTRDQLQPGFFSGVLVRRRWEFVTGLPKEFRRGPDLFVHGSPRDPTTEYLLAPEVDFKREKYSEVFELCQRLVFVGHTHLPCLITDRYEVRAPAQLADGWSFPELCDGKAIVNVGSVGQPRDDDTRACYVVVDERDGVRVRWRRVVYDFQETVAAIEQTQRLAQPLADRLKVGR
jgi:diadenosine tetraphosphatase ApaH/serine/threonine PP2A family protein phosphatase